MKNNKRFFITSILFIPLLSFGTTYYYPDTAGGSSGCSSSSLYQDSCTNATAPKGVMNSGCYTNPSTSVILANTYYYRLISPTCGTPMPSCASGSTWSGVTQSCVFPPLSTFNNDKSGCSKAGGYYLKDNRCLTLSGTIAALFSDPTAISGAFLALNGLAWTSAGLLALPITGGAGAAGISYGGHAIAAGLGMIGVGIGNTVDFSSDPSVPVPDRTDGANRMKIVFNSDGSQTVAKSDTSTGKVDQISHIPADVKQRIIDGVVNPTTGLPDNVTLSSLSGTKTTKYDYSSRLATTQTVGPTGTIETSTTPIYTSTNLDGSVTTTPSNQSITPIVTGTVQSTSQNSNWSPYSSISSYTSSNPVTYPPSATGDTTADAIINASMPSYSFPGTGDFNQLDKSVLDSIVSDGTTSITNLQGQINSVKTVFDNTESILKGGWIPPVIPAGSCGTSLQFNFHGKSVDLCPPMTRFVSQYNPVFSTLVTISGTVIPSTPNNKYGTLFALKEDG